jgi:hypothetical protein
MARRKNRERARQAPALFFGRLIYFSHNEEMTEADTYGMLLGI